MDADFKIRIVKNRLYEHGYRYVKDLGKGSFGSVLSAISPENEKVAIKIVENKNCWPFEERIWPLLSHPNILPLFSKITMEDLSLKLFVMPEQPHVLYKKLGNVLTDVHGLERIKNWFIDILSGIHYMHSKGYVHLDLKIDNVLISQDDVALICDFSGLNIINAPVKRVPAPKNFKPPEYYETMTVEGSSCDVWLFGLMALNILTKNWPVLNMRKATDAHSWKINVEPVLKEALKENNFCHLMRRAFPNSEIPDEELRLAHDFITKIMQWDPLKRPKVQSILDHPFLTSTEIGDSFHQNVIQQNEIIAEVEKNESLAERNNGGDYDENATVRQKEVITEKSTTVSDSNVKVGEESVKENEKGNKKESRGRKFIDWIRKKCRRPFRKKIRYVRLSEESE